MQIFIIRRLENANLTSNNFDIIKDASLKTGLKVNDFVSLKDAIKQGTRKDLYFATISEDVNILRLLGRKNIYFWIQGIVPEESLMRNNSTIRFKILSAIEKFALKSSKWCLPVSNAMVDHYEEKYKIELRNKSYVFPCFNTQIHKWAFDSNDKYRNNYFIYAGGLLVWQCFEETLDLYKMIEDLNYPNTKLILMTKQKELAQQEITKRGIKNYEIGFTTKEDLPNYLAKAKFGFVIRKQHPVNNVSTPTKISSYLSCGAIPICGEAVRSMLEIAEKTPYTVIWKNNNQCLEEIKTMLETNIDSENVKRDYESLFNTIYSNSYHSDGIYNLLKTNHAEIK